MHHNEVVSWNNKMEKLKKDYVHELENMRNTHKQESDHSKEEKLKEIENLNKLFKYVT
jgi:hypothetical protein